jgi:hypothetical protein
MALFPDFYKDILGDILSLGFLAKCVEQVPKQGLGIFFVEDGEMLRVAGIHKLIFQQI